MNQSLLLAIGTISTGLAAGSAAIVAGRLLDAANARVRDQLTAELEGVGDDPGVLTVYLRWWRVLTAGVLVVVWGPLDMPPVAVFAAFVVDRLGPLYIRTRVTARKKRLTEQVADTARLLGGQVRVGSTLDDALDVVARQMPDPFGTVLRRATRQLDQGRSARDVLADLDRRIKVEPVALLVIALQIAAERGGKLAAVLDRIALSLDEMQRVHRKRDADTAAGRLMVFLLALFPAVFLGFFFLMQPDLISPMFTTREGQFVVAGVGFIVYGSVRWATHILDAVEAS